MKLHFDKYGSGPVLIILHGLFGSASNFRGLARRYGEQFETYCLDLRNHGASPHDEVMSYPAMCQDIVDFMDDQAIDKAFVMGHSMGGKVAMQVALSAPERVDRLIVGDIAPVRYPPHHSRIFEGLNAIGLSSISSRGEAEEILKDYVEEKGVRLFLLTNLARKPEGGFEWRININALEGDYDHIAAAVTGEPFEGPSLFIRGALSDYIRDEHFEVIRNLFPAADIKTIPGTGHWLHAEKPEEFSALLFDFLKEDQ